MTTLLGNDFNWTTDDKSSRSFKNRINLIEGDLEKREEK